MTPFVPQKIVVPIDFSGQSGLAIESAMSLAPSANAIYCVHVMFPLDIVSPGVVLGEVTDESRTGYVQEEFARIVKDRKLGTNNLEVLIGSPGLEIADYAKRIGADLIVIPSHGYHGVKRLMLGSVAERVIRHAQCSVLVLRRGDAE